MKQGTGVILQGAGNSDSSAPTNTAPDSYPTGMPSMWPSRHLLKHSFLILGLSAFALAQEPPDILALKKGMPRDVATFISRYAECNHWGGEEPYDDARAKQIEKAVKRLRCDRLEQDEAKLLQKYRNRPNIIKAIKAAKDL